MVFRRRSLAGSSFRRVAALASNQYARRITRLHGDPANTRGEDCGSALSELYFRLPPPLRHFSGSLYSYQDPGEPRGQLVPQTIAAWFHRVVAAQGPGRGMHEPGSEMRAQTQVQRGFCLGLGIKAPGASQARNWQ